MEVARFGGTAATLFVYHANSTPRLYRMWERAQCMSVANLAVEVPPDWFVESILFLFNSFFMYYLVMTIRLPSAVFSLGLGGLLSHAL